MGTFYKVLIVASFFLFSNCTEKKESLLDEILKLTGPNHHQLERVIKHYSKDPADSLKLRAAEFLILNMPGKYSISYNAPWEDVVTVKL